jgi:predicted helicase
VALRRVLSRVVLKKRASANSDERAAWQADDLLFVSNYGEGDGRQISFAHFSQNADKADLPTLKVLGWDNRDTALHLDDVADTLHQRLAWPEDDKNAKRWREQWRSAFTLRHGEVITTSKDLAVRLADLARAIHDRIRTVLAIETENGPLTKLMKAFQQALIHDLSPDDFADMYAQTIAYGLLSARVAHPAHDTADAVATHIPVTNPFLKELMETFLHLGGRKRKERGGNGIDFDELGVSEVVELLDAANMEAVVRDFGDRNRDEDPVIHFYELFLKEYDAKKRMQRGVFYTPLPVVSYIVRSVHELLQTEFGLEDGLASTATWGEMAAKHTGLKIPDGVKSTEPFVQILDPATGTATFLVEVIDVIYCTLRTKWNQQRLTDAQQRTAWNEYVPKALLPRLHGFELMMAPYAIAHMKIGLKLYETGYRFGSDERARIYLTNSLEPPSDDSKQMIFAEWVPALAHEAQAVNAVKRHQRFTVVIGNPPYASISSNLTPQLRRIVDPYRFVNGEKIRERSMLQFEKNIQDDYIKFLAYSQARLRDAGKGICALITNHSYLDGPTLRGVRWNLIAEFQRLWLLDLHGNSNKGEVPPDGKANENVFDIKQGVSIAILVNGLGSTEKPIRKLGDCWGNRSEKYKFLAAKTLLGNGFVDIQPKAPYFYFVRPDESEGAVEWDSWPSIPDVFTKRSTGTESGFDDLLVGFTLEEVRERLATFCDPSSSRAKLAEIFDFAEGHAAELFSRRGEMRTASNKEFKRFQLRPYDYRFAFLRKELLKTNSFNVMLDLAHDSPGLVTTRQTKENFAAFAVSSFCGHKVTSGYDRSYVFPLFTTDEDSLMPTKVPCISRQVLAHFKSLSKDISSRQVDEFQLATDVLRYALAVMNAPSYAALFRSQLKRDWPRLPLTAEPELFRALARLGGELVALHLLESPRLDNLLTTYIGTKNPEVEKATHSRDTVWLDKAQTCGFRGVPEVVWNFHVGGYGD